MISLLALWIAIGNVFGRFSLGSAMPMLMNAVMIGAALLVWLLSPEFDQSALGYKRANFIAAAVVLGGGVKIVGHRGEFAAVGLSAAHAVLPTPKPRRAVLVAALLAGGFGVGGDAAQSFGGYDFGVNFGGGGDLAALLCRPRGTAALGGW